jgi:hypothetical protein
LWGDTLFEIIDPVVWRSHGDCQCHGLFFHLWGNLPTTPWTKKGEGRGPAWSNSLFEDNAEFGFGFRLSLDKQAEFAAELLTGLRGRLEEDLVDGILQAQQKLETASRFPI